ncbi:phosphonate dehydrogenase [Pseudorhodoplanes sinuspersici]|uniref:Hydroxyacid dehydrogenase n=1 Tax=Pseudorhodoplanes sinuspersici TaxID=1235591 RepID=A0A1W6ZWQ8_9HYPH|nr:phosphonate dehydrogenase [Pseudorhodoplanes sinuspersici]ARQ01760.1 hydroxyacid dehydrogenase [Pseudorhodoplanes sinuspersici]RKE73506.1 phosphonate dehydrogenase [Pseudorhodoplanes sinuspersici]
MTGKPKVVVTNPIFAETKALLDQHATVLVNTSLEPWPYDEVRAICADAAGVMAFMTDRIDAAFIADCPKLRVIGAALKGADNIDVSAATDAGVWLTIVPDLLTIPTAELAIGLMLSLGRNIVAGDRSIKARGFRGWRAQLYGEGLSGATVGIVGFGLVGRAIAGRLTGFGCRLLAYDQTPTQKLPEPVPYVTATGFDDLIATSDYVVLALPLTAETQHIIDVRAIAAMKPGARLVNPARGSLVDEAAVADAIERGHLAGYAADVFECEDWARDDRPAHIDARLISPSAPTVLTPHIGSGVTQVRREIELSAARSIIDALSSRVPDGALNNPSLGQRRTSAEPSRYAQPAAY